MATIEKKAARPAVVAEFDLLCSVVFSDVIAVVGTVVGAVVGAVVARVGRRLRLRHRLRAAKRDAQRRADGGATKAVRGRSAAANRGRFSSGATTSGFPVCGFVWEKRQIVKTCRRS